MFTASLGKNDGDKSIFELKGLPPLKLNSGHGGYFDGYIASITDWEEMSLTPNFDNILAIASGAAIQQHEPLRTIQKGATTPIFRCIYFELIVIRVVRYNTTDVLTFQYQPLVDGYHRKDAEMIGLLVGSRTKKPIHLAVFLIFLLAAVFLVTMFVAWRYDGILSRKKTMGDANMKENEDQLQGYKESQACSPSQSWNTQAVTESNLQIPSNPNPKNWNEPISETFSQSKTVYHRLAFNFETIHVTSQATNEQCISDTNELYAPIGQLGSGLSAISSIHPSSNFLKATSSTPYNLPQARISNKESPVSASRASPFNSQEALTCRLPTNTADYSKTYGHLMTNTMEMQDVNLEGYSELQLPTYMDIEKMLVERDSIKRSGCNTTQSTQNIDHYKSTDEDHNGTDVPAVADRNLTIDSFYSVYSNMLKSPKQKAAVVNLGPMYE
uniref:LAM_G_DOMAIN domain-containing protein n=1 Tax=Heterorhabditis bacteriophora TaxID=37862 RepID=A0A1I7X273_HETBA